MRTLILIETALATERDYNRLVFLSGNDYLALDEH
jgi:hypothetical protein